MGPTPITATHRVSFKYTVLGLPHKQRNYCAATPSADPTGYDITCRSPFGSVGFSLLPDQWALAVDPFFNSSTTTFDGADLEVYSAGEFIPIASASGVITPSGSAANQPANGMVISGKDGVNKNMPAFLAEGLFGLPNKLSSYAAATTAQKLLIDYFFGVGNTPVAEDAYAWRQSRGGGHAQRWLAFVVDSNQKLRRVRRIA